MVHYSLEEKINRIAIFSRLGIITLQFLANFIVPDHDAQVFLKPVSDKMTPTRLDKFVEFTLGGLTRWDGQYYLHIADYGYTYENTLAFFPLFPLLTRQLSHLSSFLVNDFFGFFFPVMKNMISPHSTLVLVSVLLNNFIFVRTARILHELTLEVAKSERIAFASAILFCFNPASIFFSAVYSESLYCYLTFYGLLRLERGNSSVGHLVLGLTGAVRSNGIVNLGFIFYEFLKMRFVGKMDFSRGLISLFGCAMAVIPFAAYQLYSYAKFCLAGSTTPRVPDFVRDYGISNGFVFPGNETNLCTQVLPLSYAYVQKRYWNVGLLNYYQAKQIPNFLLAAPMIYVIARGSFRFARRYNKSIIRLGFSGHTNPHPVDELPISAFPYVLHGVALTVFAILTIHVQVTTRMLASSSPLPYWFCAGVLSSSMENSSGLEKKILRKFGKNENSVYYECGENRKSGWKTFLFTENFSGFPLFIKWYFLTYFLAGTFMFSNFLPWT